MGQIQMLLADAVGPLAALGLEGLDLVSGLLHRAGHEPADGVPLPPHRVHDLSQCGTLLPLEHGDHLSRFAAFARPGGFLRLGGLFGLGRVLAAVAFLAALPLTGAPLAACAPPLALRFAFGSGLSAFGFSGSPSFRIRSQMRPTAALALLNPFTGVTPGRLFQMATRRSAGQLAASSASSFWLAKESKGAAVAAAASSAEPNAVLLLSLSIVNVLMIVLLGATLCAVTTSITPICLKSKGIIQNIAHGERAAMVGTAGLR